MSGSRELTVRPLSSKASTDSKHAFRIYLSPAACLLHQLTADTLCRLTKKGDPIGDALVWPAPEKIQDHIVQTSKTLQRAYSLSLGDKIAITKLEGVPRLVNTVQLEEISSEESHPDYLGESIDDVIWQVYMEHLLGRAHRGMHDRLHNANPASGDSMYVGKGMCFEGIRLKTNTRAFRVSDLDGGQLLGCFGRTSKVTFRQRDQSGLAAQRDIPQISDHGTGGLERTIQEINRTLRAGSSERSPHWYTRPLGFLLHGPKGTGKTLLLEKISRSGWGQVYHLYPSLGSSSVRKLFAEAKKSSSKGQHSLILVDQMEKWASRSGEGSIGDALDDEMRLLSTTSVSRYILVVGATSQLTDIPDYLRGPRTFKIEIDVPTPDMPGRIEILKCLRGSELLASDALLETIGGKTHGYTGLDLELLLWTANGIAEEHVYQQKQSLSNGVYGSTEALEPSKSPQDNRAEHILTEDDFNQALLRVRPSAMREISLDVPRVKWSDIGGQEEVKKRLRQAVEWPLKVSAYSLESYECSWSTKDTHQHSSLFEDAGVSFSKGVLLYGPPGCSKTLTAKALATEGGYNFIPVKGPELLNMYVGESERAVRKVFERARAASPSIIFFDEIDTIARRHQSNQHSGVHCLETLLNEMDGIESLRGVFVLAATNKPDVLDLRLLRPGRFESIYVGPPDLTARVQILTAKLAKMKIAPSVNIQDMAEKMDGHSGAEIVDVCEKAWHQWLGDVLEGGEQTPMSQTYLDDAMRLVPKQISAAHKAEYENWKPGGGEVIRQW